MCKSISSFVIPPFVLSLESTTRRCDGPPPRRRDNDVANDLDNDDDCEKQKMGDLMKMWFIIIQLLLGIDYKTSYQKKKGNINKIKKDLPDLIDLYDEKNNNISDIIDFFHEKDNIKKINNMISKQ